MHKSENTNALPERQLNVAKCLNNFGKERSMLWVTSFFFLLNPFAIRLFWDEFAYEVQASESRLPICPFQFGNSEYFLHPVPVFLKETTSCLQQHLFHTVRNYF